MTMKDNQTADGQPIVEGMIVLDNNVRPVRVGTLHYVEDQRFNGEPTGRQTYWYRVFDPVTGRSDGACDGSRMATKMRRYDGSVLYPVPMLVKAWSEEIASWESPDGKPEPDWVTDLWLACPACGAVAAEGLRVRAHAELCAYITACDNAEIEAYS
jgi:hypothetical protein